jgi:hypothetical protein
VGGGGLSASCHTGSAIDQRRRGRELGASALGEAPRLRGTHRHARGSGAGVGKKSSTACLAKRPAGPVGGAAWSCGGPICVFSTDFEHSWRGVHMAIEPPGSSS